MQVLGYIRVSTVEQAANGDSLDTQRQQIIGYAMMRGWQISQFFNEDLLASVGRPVALGAGWRAREREGGSCARPPRICAAPDPAGRDVGARSVRRRSSAVR